MVGSTGKKESEERRKYDMKQFNPQFGLWDVDEAEMPNRYPHASQTLDTKIETGWRRKYYRRRPIYRNKFLNVRTLKGFQRKRKIRKNKKYWRNNESAETKSTGDSGSL